MRRMWAHFRGWVWRRGTGERRFRVVVSVLVLVVVLGSTPAWASPGLSWMGDTFDITDSRGIRLSQYEISMDDGGTFHPVQGVWFGLIQMVWTLHTAIIGILGALLDWTVSLTWVGWLAGPFTDIQKMLHTQLLGRVGATAWGGGVLVLVMLISGSLAGIKIMRGRTSGWWDLLRGVVASALAVGFFAAPVTGVIGDGSRLAEPLAAVQRIGSQISVMITSTTAPTGKVTGSQPITTDSSGRPVFTTSTNLKVSSMLVDSFVRPVHQQLNYGQVIDSTGCQGAYDKVLKAGPYGDTAKPQRDAMKACDKKYGDYTDSAAGASWLVGYAYFETCIVALSLLLLLFTITTWYYVAKMLWAALVSMIDILKAIPGHTEPLLRDVTSIFYGLLFYISSLAVLSIILKVIANVFAAGGTNLAVKFLVTDVVIVIGIVLFIIHLVRHHRGEKKMGDRLKAWFHAKDRDQPSIGQGASHATAMAARQAKQAAMRRLTGHGPAAHPMARPAQAPHLGSTTQMEPTSAAPGTTRKGSVTKTMTATAAAALTGGAGVVIRKAAMLNQAYQTMRSGGGTTPGHTRATNAAMAATARAHNYLSDMRTATGVIAHQTRTGAPVRSTTGIKPLDSAARTAGLIAAGLDTAAVTSRAKAAKVTVPIARQTTKLSQPPAAATHLISAVKDRAHQEAHNTADWARVVSAPITVMMTPPGRIGPQPAPTPATPPESPHSQTITRKRRPLAFPAPEPADRH